MAPTPASGWAVTAWLCLALLAGMAMAQLYGPEAPQDVAWVRVINAGDSDAITAEIGGTSLEIAFSEASPYMMVSPGNVSLVVDGEAVELVAEPETFFTVAALEESRVVVAEPGLRDVSRGLLGLMNLTQRPALSLLTPDGIPVVEDVAPGHADAVAVSAARTALDVAAGGEQVAQVAEHAFERGVAYTVVAIEAADGLLVVIATATAD